MYYLVIIVAIVLVVLYYTTVYKKKNDVPIHTEEKIVVDTAEEKIVSDITDEETFVSNNWQGSMANYNLEPSIVQSHDKYVQNVRQYSSGANFSAISDDNVSPMQTNFIGFSRPRFVDIDPTARQVPDYDHTTLKRNKHMVFVSDL
jgi:hypothetical protein